MEDDAAYVKLGEPWRIPTDAEICELIDKCDWHWTQLNDVNGYTVTGPNGNSIFLPAAGARGWGNSAGFQDLSSRGYYWSNRNNGSTIQEIEYNQPQNAIYIGFSSANVNRLTGNETEYDKYGWPVSRWDGCSIRPVCD